ncbi:hypothetical protein AYO20_04293 [Fonsecaea nubica]|uniref:Uncharacterized protein n=1 Tax=Fonsecaea nubica TaxID=856822 RepID=A0A178D3X5_9EURO|nr:hypothetical protein AYO20_04293 [Fonsecaea nubica]OAL36397.1 hypothetical protein AYO20_04293 [Fonsecaea nubica]
MVFNPSSPIRVFARQQVIIHRATPKPHKEGPKASVAKRINEMTSGDMPQSSSPASGWRVGVSRLMRQSQDPPHPPPPPKEVSRWSKTTTESEISDAFPEPPSSLPDKRRSFLKRKSKLKRQSKDTANSSPTDPFYDPVTRQLQPFGDVPPIIATAGDGQPRTMSTSDSDASSELDQTSPVIHRASSVRVSKPHIVLHSNSSGGSVPRLYAPHSTPTSTHDGPSTAKTSQTLGEDLKHLSNLTDVEKSEEPVVPGGPGDALKALEGREEQQQKEGDITALPRVPAEVSTECGDTMKETILEWPDTPSRIEALDTLPTPFGGFGSVRVPRTSNATYSTSGSTNTTYVSPPSIITDGLRANPPSENDKKLSRAISAPVRNPARRVMIRPTDLIINKGVHDHKLYRENIVSTPYPARHSSIGEIDQIAAPGARATGNKTPKIKRSRPLSHHTEKSAEQDGEGEGEGETKTTNHDDDTTGQDIQDDDEKRDMAPGIPFSTKPTPLSPTPAPLTAKSDRFPSPSAPEILFLDLRLARHPSARITVEIEVTDKATFDDEQLFTMVRHSYVTKLMGRGRWWFCARSLEAASTGIAQCFDPNVPFWYGQPQHLRTSGSATEFDGADFVRHLLNPRVGRRRKTWLLWLRNLQSVDAHGNDNSKDHNGIDNANVASPARRTRGRGRRSHLAQHDGYAQGYGHSPQQGDGSATSPVFSFMHSRTNSDGISNNNEASSAIQANSLNNMARAGAGLGSGGGLVGKQPSVSLPRMPFQPSAMSSFHRTKSLAAHASATTMPLSSSPSTISSPYTANPYASYLFHLQQHQPPLLPVQNQGPPTIHLHHTFSLPSMAIFTFVLLMLSVLTTTFWILFGYPGRSAAAGNGTTTVAGNEYALSWRRDAQARVGVGLVMGVVVLLLGAGCEVAWVWTSWVLV